MDRRRRRERREGEGEKEGKPEELVNKGASVGSREKGPGAVLATQSLASAPKEPPPGSPHLRPQASSGPPSLAFSQHRTCLCHTLLISRSYNIYLNICLPLRPESSPCDVMSDLMTDPRCLAESLHTVFVE